MTSDRLGACAAGTLAALIACSLVLVAVVPAPAGAIDSAVLLYFDSGGFADDTTEIEAAPGETVTLELVASAHGNPAGEGLVGLEYTVEYDSDVLTVTGVERGSMLALGSESGDGNGTDDGNATAENGTDDGNWTGQHATVDGTVDIDAAAGTVTVEQERVPPGDGATGDAPTAILTVRVAEDAPSTDSTLEITDGSAAYPSDYSVTPIERDATIVVDGEADPDDDSGITDTVPGFAALSALIALAAGFWLRDRR